jgi:hypothetical protein
MLPYLKIVGEILFKIIGIIFMHMIKTFKFIILFPIKLFKGLYNFITGAIFAFKNGVNGISIMFRVTFLDPIKRLFKSLSKAAAPVLKKMQPVIDMISNFFSMIGTKINSMITSITKVISDLLDWIGAVSDYGIMDYKEHKQQIESSEKDAAQSIVVQAAKTDATEAQLKATGQLTAKEIQDALQLRTLSKETGVSATRLAAAKKTGLLTALNDVNTAQAKAVQALNFSMSNTGTLKLAEKGQ